MTYTITPTFARTGESISVALTFTVTGEVAVGDPSTGLVLPIGTNVEVAFACDVSQVTVVFITATTACSIYVNDVSGGSPTATITVPAGGVIEWYTGGQGTNPLGSTNPTKLYVTNAAETALKIRVGIGDETP